MNNNVRMPIITTKDGNKISKVCVENIYKIIDRIYDRIDKAEYNMCDILNSVVTEKYLNKENLSLYSGDLIVGRGYSQPCLDDAFDEEIGNNIAFMKAKLNANMKKHNILVRIWNEYNKVLEGIDAELSNIDNYIRFDLDGIRKHNPDYLTGIEEKLGI